MMRMLCGWLCLSVVACGGGTPDSGGTPDAAVVSPGTFSLALDPDTTFVQLAGGASTELAVVVTRGNGFADDVTVTVTGLPAGVTAGSLLIPASATRGTLTLSAAPSVAKGAGMASIKGAGGGRSSMLPLAITAGVGSGRFDATFGRGGVARVDMPSTQRTGPTGMIALAGGGLLVFSSPMSETSSGGVVRLTAQGALDPAFGSGGVVTLPGQASVSRGSLTSDGKIVLAGNTTSREGFNLYEYAAIWRLLPDGSLDASFGQGGRAVLGNLEQVVTALVVGDDGSMRATVVRYGGPTDGGVVRVLKLRPDGTLDSGFGDGGMVTTTFPGASPNAFWACADGSWLIHLYYLSFMHKLVRLAPSGELDTTFGEAGYLTLNQDIRVISVRDAAGRTLIAGGEEATSAPIMIEDTVTSSQPYLVSFPDGRTLQVLGSQIHTFNDLIVHARAGGVTDTTFGIDGYVSAARDLGVTGIMGAAAVGLDASGRVVFMTSPPQQGWLIARLLL